MLIIIQLFVLYFFSNDYNATVDLNIFLVKKCRHRIFNSYKVDLEHDLTKVEGRVIIVIIFE